MKILNENKKSQGKCGKCHIRFTIETSDLAFNKILGLWWGKCPFCSSNLRIDDELLRSLGIDSR